MALHSFDLASETKNQGGTALCYLFGKAFTLAWSEFSNFLVMCTPWCGANWWFEKLTRDMLCTRTLERSRLWKHRKCLRWGTACLLWHWPSIITEGVAWDTTTKDTHTLRTFVVVYEKIFGAPSTAYTEELHRWFTRGLSTRSACVTFPARDARSFREFVTDLQAVLGSDFTIAWSTVFVLRCETRQVCQTYGILGVQKMAHAVHRGKQDIRRRLQASLKQGKSKLQASCQRKLVTLLHCPR